MLPAAGRADSLAWSRNAWDLRAIGLWHCHCVGHETREGMAMTKIMSALVTAILVAAALLEWVATRM
jgi:hypothetical protein